MVSTKKVTDPCQIPKEQWKHYECPNVEMTYSDFDKETYECKVCGLYYSLYYDDMK